MRLLFIRHGETDDNAGRLALGQRDVLLNERGRAQAQSLAGALADRYEIEAIYSSPLQRTMATARPLADELRLDIAIEPALREMDIGELESLPVDEVRARYPDFMKQWLSDELADAVMPGGESLRQVQERAWAAVEGICERHPAGLVAIVSHNFVILTLLCAVLDVPLAQFRRLRQDLGAFSLVDVTPERRTLLRLNDCCHVP
jgi:broad specificity phosphatase PhoE